MTTFTDSINEIDWMYVEWGLQNRFLLQENKVDPAIQEAVLESFDRVSEMLKRSNEVLDELKSEGFVEKLDEMVEECEKW